jgi:hypothetical protein
MKEHCGMYTKAQVTAALAQTRISASNREVVLDYLVHGTRLKDLAVSKQAAYARIRKVIPKLE